jgi:ABC-type uncharacterized transport system permease subunit
MKRQGNSVGKTVLIVLFSLLAVLVVVNGVVLLCESDPGQFYSNLFNKFAVHSTVAPTGNP